jgi:hypothetical protein
MAATDRNAALYGKGEHVARLREYSRIARDCGNDPCSADVFERQQL